MPTPEKELTQTRLKELLHYDPETGHFTWRVSRGGTAKIGARAGAAGNRRYIRFQVDKVKGLAHRFAFLYMTGEWPPADVDHINRDRADNRWVNLRPATRWENMGNVGLRKDNTSGHRGVCRHKPTGKWEAHGRRAGRRVYLGLFMSVEAAAAAAHKWREENFGIFAA